MARQVVQIGIVVTQEQCLHVAHDKLFRVVHTSQISLSLSLSQRQLDKPSQTMQLYKIHLRIMHVMQIIVCQMVMNHRVQMMQKIMIQHSLLFLVVEVVDERAMYDRVV